MEDGDKGSEYVRNVVELIRVCQYLMERKWKMDLDKVRQYGARAGKSMRIAYEACDRETKRRSRRKVREELVACTIAMNHSTSSRPSNAVSRQRLLRHPVLPMWV